MSPPIRKGESPEYSSYLWWDGDVLMEKPIILEKDSVVIGARLLGILTFTPYLELNINGSLPADEHFYEIIDIGRE